MKRGEKSGMNSIGMKTRFCVLRVGKKFIPFHSIFWNEYGMNSFNFGMNLE